jgi:hypothetical protein
MHTQTLVLLLNVVVHLADIQARDGAFNLIHRARAGFEVLLPKRWMVERTFAWLEITSHVPVTADPATTVAALIRLAMIPHHAQVTYRNCLPIDHTSWIASRMFF